MAQPTIPLFIDVQARQLVRSFTSTVPAVLPIVYQGDTLTLVVRFLQPTGVRTAPYTDVDYSEAAVTVAAGEIGAKPTAGTFTITDTSVSQTTAPLSYEATAAQVQTAIQAALTTHWSNATVLGGTGGPFTITNGSNGSQTALIGSSLTLAPASSVPINTLQVGTSSLPQIEYVQLTVNPFALQNTWAASSDPDLLTGNLSFATSSLEEIMGANPFISTTFSIQVIPAGGEPFTVYQRNFVIENDLIDGAPSIPTPSVRYYTTVESDARYAGQGVFTERDSTGSSALHITTSNAGANNVLFLITNANSTVNFTFDNGTFDGQTITYRTDASITSITYSGNVSGVLDPDSIYGDGALLSFMWDAQHSVWLPM